ncbi:MAG: hypothetical protein ABSG49_05350 [Methanoregula sp.]|jgi:hypothetical protein|uniref:hypothetical protein n=1 Tax=Methanoregula sp. TaxID=2052170 RepID=UPI003C16CACD
MDDLIQSGIVIILALCAAAGIFLYAIVHLFLLELHALADGDTGFILASIGSVLLLCACYIGTGLWLRRTGRI